MSGITKIMGRIFHLPGNDIDTDRIIPARFLKCLEFEGLGAHVFEDDRKAADSLHPFDLEENQGCTVLLVDAGFGSGSSREHAPVAIKDWGVVAIIAISYGTDIYHGNSTMNEKVLVTVSEGDHATIANLISNGVEVNVTIDLEKMMVFVDADGNVTSISCDMPSGLRHKLLDGMTTWASVDLMLESSEAIRQLSEHRPSPLAN